MKKSVLMKGLAGIATLLLSGSALACYENPFYPVVEGASWTYQASDGSQFTQSITAVSADSFTMQLDMGGDMEPMEMTYTCDEGGVLSTGGLAAAMPVGVDIEVVRAEGLTYPTDLSVGQTWHLELETLSNMEMEGMAATSTMTMVTDNTAQAIESVTVPAGTFDALLITADSTVTTVTQVMGMEVPFSVDTTSSTWLVEGVGMVLSEAEGSRTELVSYNIP